MTRAAFTLQGRNIVAVRIDGHSGYAEEGSDIVCAGVSSAVMLVHALLCDVMGMEISTRVEMQTPLIELRIPQQLDPGIQQRVQDAMAALMVHLTALQEQYPDYLSVLEV